MDRHKREPTLAPRLSRFAMPASIGLRLLTIAAQIRRTPMPIGKLGTIEENPTALFRRTGLQARESIRLGQAIHFRHDQASLNLVQPAARPSPRRQPPASAENSCSRLSAYALRLNPAAGPGENVPGGCAVHRVGPAHDDSHVQQCVWLASATGACASTLPFAPRSRTRLRRYEPCPAQHSGGNRVKYRLLVLATDPAPDALAQRSDRRKEVPHVTSRHLHGGDFLLEIRRGARRDGLCRRRRGRSHRVSAR
jgi:hypothetical protein